MGKATEPSPPSMEVFFFEHPLWRGPLLCVCCMLLRTRVDWVPSGVGNTTEAVLGPSLSIHAKFLRSLCRVSGIHSPPLTSSIMRVIVIPTVTLPSERTRNQCGGGGGRGLQHTGLCRDEHGNKKKTLIFIYLFLVCVLFLQRKTGVSFIVL